MWDRSQRDAVRASTCRHFVGMQHKRCKADVVLVSVRDTSQPGPYRWPCITMPGKDSCAAACPKFSALTAEEIAAEEADIHAAVAQFSQRRRNGQCPECGAASTFVVSGRCEYAKPCGHRVGQVSAGEDEPW